MLFIAFAALLMWAALRALRWAKSPWYRARFQASSVFAYVGRKYLSFRWMGSGLLFFSQPRLCRNSHHARRVIGSRLLSPEDPCFRPDELCLWIRLSCGSSLSNVHAGDALNSREGTGRCRKEMPNISTPAALRWNHRPATRIATVYGFTSKIASAEALPHLRYASHAASTPRLLRLRRKRGGGPGGDPHAAERTWRGAASLPALGISLSARGSA